MNYIGEIFTRADIQKIRGFLLMGTEETRVDPRPYEERIESAHNKFQERLRKDYPDRKALEEVTERIYHYASTIEDVYMEIGLQIGVILAAQTAQNRKMALEGK